MSKLEDTRNKFLKMRGGKLISVEAVMLAFVVFFAMTVEKNASPYLALVIAFIVGFVFPILVGAFKSLAWLAAILFSLVWAFLGFVFAGAIAGGSVLVGLLSCIIVFAISFMIHKNYSGLTFQGFTRKNNNSVSNMTMVDKNSHSEAVVFCPKCGRRITSYDGKCDVCNG